MKRIRLLALLLITGILLVSCGQDPSGTSAVIGPPPPEPQRSPGFDLDDLEYETISGTLPAGQSGGMYAYLKTWPRDCVFSLVVPVESMPGEGSIDFTMRIPTQASYLAHAEELHHRLIIRLGPDGQSFLGPITVTGTWMPWQGAPPTPLYYNNGSEQGETTVTQVGNRYRVSFQVFHFSDWEVGPEPIP